MSADVCVAGVVVGSCGFFDPQEVLLVELVNPEDGFGNSQRSIGSQR
jgi:hypothetical protein